VGRTQFFNAGLIIGEPLGDLDGCPAALVRQ